MRITLTLLACAALLAGCRIPDDPEGTLERVDGGVVRVGMTVNPPWTELRDGRRAGIEVALVEELARSLRARTAWTDGAEAQLIEALEAGELDLVIGGVTKDSPWSDHAALTRPYATSTSEQGRRQEHVMVAPLGENAWLMRLERFLLEREDAVRERLREEAAR
jgi:polar amino acid transport system substrate-binding protein